MAKRLTELKDVFGNLKKDPHNLESLKKAKKAYEMKVVMENLPNDYRGLSFRKALEANFPKENFGFDFDQLVAQELAEKERMDMERISSPPPDEVMDDDVDEKPQTIAITNPKAQIKELQDQVSEKDEELKKLHENLQRIDKTAKEDLQRAVEGYKKEAEQLKEELKEAAVFKSRAEELQGLFDAKVGQIEDLQRVNKTLLEENKNLKAENGLINDLQKKIDEMSSANTKCLDDETLQKFLVAQDQLTKENDSLSTQLKEAEKTIASYKERVDELEDEPMDNVDSATEALLSGLKADKADLQKQLEATKIRLAEIDNKECDNCKALNKKIADKDDELKQLHEELEETNEKLEEARGLAGIAQANTQRLEKVQQKKLNFKDEEIGILEEKIGILEKQAQDKAVAESEKPVDFKALADSMEIGELEEKVAKFEKRAKKAPILGKLALLPPLCFIFWPFTPKRSWGGIKALLTYPVGIIFNVIFWAACLFGTLSLIHQFTPANKPAKEYTAKAYDSIKKVTDEAQIYFSYDGDAKAVADIGVSQAELEKKLAEKDGEWLEKLKAYVLRAEAEADLKKALVANDASWQEKLKAYLLKSDVDTNYVLKAELAKYILKTIVGRDYILKTEVEADLKKALADNDASWQEKLKLYVLRAEAEADKTKAVSAKHKEWDSFYEEQKLLWKRQLTDAKKTGGTANPTLYILKKDAEEDLRFQLLKRDAEWQKALDTVNGDLKAEKTKVSDLVNEKAVLKQAADLVPGLQKALATYKAYNPAIAAIKIIRMDSQGFIDCPSDRPQGTMTWFVDSFLKRGYPASSKFQINKEGLISVHYAGASLIRDYKGTKYYLVVKAETPKK